MHRCCQSARKSFCHRYTCWCGVLLVLHSSFLYTLNCSRIMAKMARKIIKQNLINKSIVNFFVTKMDWRLKYHRFSQLGLNIFFHWIAIVSKMKTTLKNCFDSFFSDEITLWRDLAVTGISLFVGSNCGTTFTQYFLNRFHIIWLGTRHYTPTVK